MTISLRSWRMPVLACVLVVLSFGWMVSPAPSVAPASAATGTGSVSGMVTDATGHPLGGSVLVSIEQFNRESVAGTTSAADGSFLFERIQPGRYRLRFLSRGGSEPVEIMSQYYQGTPLNMVGTDIVVTAGTVTALKPARLQEGGYFWGDWTCPSCELADGSGILKVEMRDPDTAQWLGVSGALQYSISDPMPDQHVGTYQLRGMYPGTYRTHIVYLASDEIRRGGYSREFVVVNNGEWTEIPSVSAMRQAIQRAPGSLVRTTAASSVYMTDGSDGLVPVADLAAAADFGFSTNITTITAAQLRAATITSRTLSTFFRCDSDTALASAGSSYVLPAGSSTGRVPFFLPPEICWELGGRTRLSNPVFIKGSGSPEVRLLEDGEGRPIPNVTTLAAMRSGRPLITIRPAAMKQFPAGTPVPAVGSLVKDAVHATVYLVDTPRSFVPVRSFQSVLDMGLQRTVTTLPTALVGQTSKSSAVLSNFVRCNGASWLASGGALLPMRAAAAGNAPVTNLSTWLCTQRARPSSHVADGTRLFIRATGSPRVYLVSGGVKQAVSSPAVLKRLAPP